MAVNIRQLFPLQQAKERRDALLRALHLDGGRHLIAAIILIIVLSLVSLGQTGRLASQGYEITRLNDKKALLLRERNAMLLQLSQAQSLNSIQQRANELQLRPLTTDQVRYITIDPAEPEEAGAPGSP
jgi:hypothetical protein